MFSMLLQHQLSTYLKKKKKNLGFPFINQKYPLTLEQSREIGIPSLIKGVFKGRKTMPFTLDSVQHDVVIVSLQEQQKICFIFT